MADAWSDQCRPCKIGTVPWLVRLRKDDLKRMKVGRWVRVQFTRNSRWEWVLVTRVDDDGYFMADR